MWCVRRMRFAARGRFWWAPLMIACVAFAGACTGKIGDLSGISGLGPPDPGASMGTGGAAPVGTDADGGAALPADDVPVDFFIDIQPILGDYCVRCHGGVRELPIAPKTPLNLQSRERAERVLGHAGDAESSMLYLRVSATDPNIRMPLSKQALPAEKLNKLRRWIYQGAPWPQQWSFAPIKDVQPTQMTVSDEAWVRTPVDRFIMNRLDKEGIKPSPEADATTLIRRVSLDLTGLPPTPPEIDAFVADTSSIGYEKLVDRLLASPRFGERWGRHWLDLARYSDSDGYEKDRVRPNAWRWRDWVIDSFNQDQPFDQFTIEQMAGDLLPGATPLQATATGFHRNTLLNREGGTDPEEDRSKRIIDRAATVAETWLGLTMGCTQCHSHPYDNIKQKELYQLVAFFNNADDQLNGTDSSDPVVDIGATVQVSSTADGQGPMVAAYVLQERAQNRRPTYLFKRGDFLNPDKTEALVGNTPAVLPPLVARGAQADRLDLGRWLVDSKNPLTPRVTVNTMWYHLFGQGIVTSLDDFGARAQYPSHPELLDWLAGDFVKNGWKRKRVIKEIVMSATYRQSAVLRSGVTNDPENVWLWRQNRVRVDAEIVADINLSAAGLLATKMGGPSAFPPLPPELRDLVRGAYGHFTWPDTTGADRYRRGVYTFHKRLALYPNLDVFDWPSANVTTTGRQRTNTPLQALAALHNVLFVEASQGLAQRVQVEKPGNLQDQLIWAFRLATARAPTGDELSKLEALFTKEKNRYAADSQAAATVVGKLIPSGAAPADAAAWVATASTILNLDEVINRE
jgi:Protein of unknown function (DUF1549)/Protein of unknown function (DUF1553)/Planctomycete cytochrome C